MCIFYVDGRSYIFHPFHVHVLMPLVVVGLAVLSLFVFGAWIHLCQQSTSITNRVLVDDCFGIVGVTILWSGNRLLGIQWRFSRW